MTVAAEYRVLRYEPTDRIDAAKAYIDGTRLLSYGQYEQIRLRVPHDLDERQAVLDADRRVYKAFMRKLKAEQKAYRAEVKAAAASDAPSGSSGTEGMVSTVTSKVALNPEGL